MPSHVSLGTHHGILLFGAVLGLSGSAGSVCVQSQGSELTGAAEGCWGGSCHWDVGVRAGFFWERQTRRAPWIWWQHWECTQVCLEVVGDWGLCSWGSLARVTCCGCLPQATWAWEDEAFSRQPLQRSWNNPIGTGVQESWLILKDHFLQGLRWCNLMNKKLDERSNTLMWVKKEFSSCIHRRWKQDQNKRGIGVLQPCSLIP